MVARARVRSLLILLLVAAGVLAPLLAPANPQRMSIADRLHAPSLQHLLGTDDFGRDVFSRVLYGIRLSLTIGAAVAILRLLHPGLPSRPVGGDLVSRDELRREMQIFETHMEDWAEQLRHLYDRARQRVDGGPQPRRKPAEADGEELNAKDRARRKARERGFLSASPGSLSERKDRTIS